MIDDMVAAEARHLSQRATEEECDCKDGMFPSRAPANRRIFYSRPDQRRRCGSCAARRISRRPAGAAGAKHFDVPADPTKEQGRAVAADGGYGSRSQFETEVRVRYPTANENTSWTFTPLDKSLGNLTPSGLHFERHHGGIPTIDPAKHTLYRARHGRTAEEVHHGGPEAISVGNAQAFHRMLRQRPDRMEEADAEDRAGHARAAQHVGMDRRAVLDDRARSRPQGRRRLGAGRRRRCRGDDAQHPDGEGAQGRILAYGQNGEAIRPEQGYPLRLLLPGYEGNTHIKWLRRLEVSDKPFMTREETSKYTDLMADGKARQFTFDMDAKSVITFPSGEMRLPGPGFYKITGFAWSGRGRVQSVDVSTRRRQDLVAGATRLGAGADLHGALQLAVDLGRQAGRPAEPLHRRDRLHSADAQATDRHPRLERAVRVDLSPQCDPELGRREPMGASPMSMHKLRACGCDSSRRVRIHATALPAGRARFGFGTPATPEPSSRRTSRSRPRARGLPPGSGNATEGAQGLRGAVRRLSRREARGQSRQRHRRRQIDRRARHACHAKRRSRRSRATGPMPRRCSTTSSARCRSTRRARSATTRSMSVVAYILSEAKIIKPTRRWTPGRCPRWRCRTETASIPILGPSCSCITSGQAGSAGTPAFPVLLSYIKNSLYIHCGGGGRLL